MSLSDRWRHAKSRKWSDLKAWELYLCAWIIGSNTGMVFVLIYDVVAWWVSS